MLKKIIPFAAAAALATGLVGCYEGPQDEGFEGGGGGFSEPYDNEREGDNERRMLDNRGTVNDD